MKRDTVIWGFLLSALTLHAQTSVTHEHHGEHNMASATMMSSPDPDAPREEESSRTAKEQQHSQPSIDPADADYFPYEMGPMRPDAFWSIVADQMEIRASDGPDLFRWDIEGWYGGDFNRLRLRSEGETGLQGGNSGTAEIHGYYSRLFAPFWEYQIGARADIDWKPGDRESRAYASIGIEGFAPYRFELTGNLFVSDAGDLSARLTATRDLRITQRLIAQGRFETEIAAQDTPSAGIGTGFNYVELGLRFRYEIRREFAPYAGVNWERKLGQSGNLARQLGEDPDVLSFVAGIRIWY